MAFALVTNQITNRTCMTRITHVSGRHDGTGNPLRLGHVGSVSQGPSRQATRFLLDKWTYSITSWFATDLEEIAGNGSE
jgi:hypothetical protein